MNGNSPDLATAKLDQGVDLAVRDMQRFVRCRRLQLNDAYLPVYPVPARPKINLKKLRSVAFRS